MRLFTTTLITLSSLLTFATAQTSCDSVAARIPICGKPCLLSAATVVGCQDSDYRCQCTPDNIVSIESLASDCVVQGCGIGGAQSVEDSALAVCDCAATAPPKLVKYSVTAPTVPTSALADLSLTTAITIPISAPATAGATSSATMSPMTDMPGMSSMANMPGMSSMTNMPGMSSMANIPGTTTVAVGTTATKATSDAGALRVGGSLVLLIGALALFL